MQGAGLLSQVDQTALAIANLLLKLASFALQATNVRLAFLQLGLHAGDLLPQALQHDLQPLDVRLGLLQLGTGSTRI